MSKIQTVSLQRGSLGIAKTRFALVLLLAVYTIATDAWNLIAPGAVLDRWMLIGSILALNAVAWYASRVTTKTPLYYRVIIFLQILLDIGIATFLVYSERGIASSSVLLYVLPLITAAVLQSRSAVIATAALCAASYGLAAIRYQFLHPGESYKVELYALVFFYGLLFIIMAAGIAVALRLRKQD